MVCRDIVRKLVSVGEVPRSNFGWESGNMTKVLADSHKQDVRRSESYVGSLK
jgi:hypothetical protein